MATAQQQAPGSSPGPAVQYATAVIDPPKPFAKLLLGGESRRWPAQEVPLLLSAICRQVLQRESDALVEASFAEGLQSGELSVRDVVYSLAMSDDYREKFGTHGGPQAFVEHCYRRLLAREGEPAGVAYWTSVVGKDGLPACIRGHLTSPEYLTRFGVDLVPDPERMAGNTPYDPTAGAEVAAAPAKPAPAKPAPAAAAPAKPAPAAAAPAKPAPAPAKPPAAHVKGLVHLQDKGDQPLADAQWAGTKGQSRRLEGFQLALDPPVTGLSLQYMAHLADKGDTAWTEAGQFCGTRHQARRLEGIAVRLTGPNAGKYDVHYQVHEQNVGDVAEQRNGAFCGTRGQARRVEAIRVWVTVK